MSRTFLTSKRSTSDTFAVSDERHRCNRHHVSVSFTLSGRIEAMKVGFSLSPGGLLLPYHLGALASLAYHGFLTEKTPLAGSSAGAIAVASQASGVDSLVALEASRRVSSKCLYNPFLVPSGGLLPCLQRELEDLLPKNAHHVLNERPGTVALAHRELFPNNKAVLQTKFPTRNCLMDAVCDSSMFPYFLTNQPFRTVKRINQKVPRVVVDGFFACPMENMGCPPLDECRTVTISVFPKELLKLSKVPKHDKIGPSVFSGGGDNIVGQTAKLVRQSTQGCTTKETTELYESGWSDAERWAHQELQRVEKTRRTHGSRIGGR